MSMMAMCNSHDTYIARPYECDGYVTVKIVMIVVQLQCSYPMSHRALNEVGKV